MPIGNLFKKVADKFSGGFLSGAAEVIEKFVADPTKKMEAVKELETLKIKHEEFIINAEKELETEYLKDTQNARDTNARIQESENASWLAKNIAYCIDGIFVVAFFVGLLLIYNKAVPEENKELFYTGFGALTSYVATILNFHRGTSIGSKKNGDTLRSMVTK